MEEESIQQGLERGEPLAMLRAAELKWARKCLVALLMFLIIVTIVTVIAYHVSKALEKRD
jgi:hypothetical protein